jgi:hypothetical protein
MRTLERNFISISDTSSSLERLRRMTETKRFGVGHRMIEHQTHSHHEFREPVYIRRSTPLAILQSLLCPLSKQRKHWYILTLGNLVHLKLRPKDIQAFVLLRTHFSERLHRGPCFHESSSWHPLNRSCPGTHLQRLIVFLA